MIFHIVSMSILIWLQEKGIFMHRTWYGFTLDEQNALETAQSVGYLVNLSCYHFTLYEAWRLSCERSARPMIVVGRCREYRSVVLDTTTVFDNVVCGAPSIMPTERIRERIERIAHRYVQCGEHQARLTPSYVFLPHIASGRAEVVARLLVKVWREEASFFARQERLWQAA